jgi:arylsulfatase A-like enzyme
MVPLIIYVPDGPHGERTDAIVQAPDLRPTITELLGVEDDGDVHGRSLAPILRGEADSHREFAFSSGFIPEDRPQLKTRVAVNSEDGWALHFHPEYEPELYHMPEDPGEESNIIADHRDQADRLHTAFLDFLRELDASEPVIKRCAQLGPSG